MKDLQEMPADPDAFAIKRSESEAQSTVELPWCDCKVAFDIEDGDALWSWDASGVWPHLPEGWTLDGTDGSGARLVAIFRVETLLTIEDGERVAQLLVTIGAALPSNGVQS
jgi:hypothetical protein